MSFPHINLSFVDSYIIFAAAAAAAPDLSGYLNFYTLLQHCCLVYMYHHDNIPYEMITYLMKQQQFL